MRDLMAAALLVGMVLVGLRCTPVAAAPVTCADMGGIMTSGSICHVRVSTPTYSLDMMFPVDYPDQQALMSYLSQNRDGFVSVAQTSEPHDQPYQMVVTTEQHQSGQSPHGTRSVVLKLFQDFGSTAPFSWYRAFNYNLDRKKPIAFDTLFAPGAKPLDSIYPVVQQELERRFVAGATVSRSAGMDPAHYQNFAITDDELLFYFAQGELLLPFLGPAHAWVPRSAVPPLAL
ncbi:MAG: RsiV family protein [Mycobacteriaceae bacterium]|nr:RsiV family protein [Mycobacteriaceae bacterium]